MKKVTYLLRLSGKKIVGSRSEENQNGSGDSLVIGVLGRGEGDFLNRVARYAQSREADYICLDNPKIKSDNGSGYEPMSPVQISRLRDALAKRLPKTGVYLAF